VDDSNWRRLASSSSRHPIEGAHQIADFIGGADINPVVKAPTGNFLGCLRQRCKRTRDQLGEEQSQPCGHEQDDHCEQQQKSDVSLPHAAALAAPLEISLLAGLNLAHSLRELGRKRNRDQNRAPAGHCCASQRVVRIMPGELRRTSRQRLGERQRVLHDRPSSRSVKAYFRIAIA
jgi:hypothetical protein